MLIGHGTALNLPDMAGLWSCMHCTALHENLQTFMKRGGVLWPQGRPQHVVPSSSAQASIHHAVHRRTTSTGWLRLLSTTEARTVNVQCLDGLMLESVDPYGGETGFAAGVSGIVPGQGDRPKEPQGSHRSSPGITRSPVQNGAPSSPVHTHTACMSVMHAFACGGYDMRRVGSCPFCVRALCIDTASPAAHWFSHVRFSL